MVTNLSSYLMKPHEVPNGEGIDFTADIESERQYRAFQRSLKPGYLVEARWTESQSPRRATAIVHQVNGKSVRCELLEPAGVFAAGELVTVPLKRSDRSTSWTRERGIFPRD